MYAAQNGHTTVVTALLAVPGIDVNAKGMVCSCLLSCFLSAISFSYPRLSTRPYKCHDARARGQAAGKSVRAVISFDPTAQSRHGGANLNAPASLSCVMQII